MAWRLRFFYCAYFAVTGLMMPYFPLWLSFRGLDATGIGIVNGVSSAIRVVAAPVVGAIADRIADRRRLMQAMAIVSLLLFGLYALAEGLWPTLAVMVVIALFWSAVLPLGESYVFAASQRANLDFSRIRLWGSVAFIAASAIGGVLLDGRSPWMVFWMVGFAMAVLAAAHLTLPAAPVPPRRIGRMPIRILATDRLFLLFVAGNGLVQASHSMLYAFATLHWRSLGIGETEIGLLWAEGVIAEIVLFAFGARVAARLGPHGLMLLGAGAGLVRWSGAAFATEVWQLALLQLLHGLTFGATYLGQMHFIARAVRPEAAASAQTLVAAAGAGLAMGGGFLAAGPLYEAFGGGAFLAMALLSLAGGGAGLVLHRRWGARVVG